MAKKIYKVAHISNDYEIIINAGLNDGISNGSEFLIYSLSEEDILDPTSGENLGKLEIVKGKGKVVHVQDKMSTIESSNFKRNPKTTIVRKTNPLFSIPTEERRITDNEDIRLPFSEVSIGDNAKLIG